MSRPFFRIAIERIGCALLILQGALAHAQTPASPPALTKAQAEAQAQLQRQAQLLAPNLPQATSVDTAMGVLGARGAEVSTFLLLDVPDVALAGKVKARLSSELAGTSWLVLLRGRAGQAPVVVPGQPPQSALLGVWRFKAGAPAKATLQLDFNATESFTLLAFTRGRWFSVERQIKLALPTDAAAAAKEARARKVDQITSRTAAEPAPPAASAASAAAASASASAPAPAPVGAASAPAPVASSASAPPAPASAEPASAAASAAKNP